jgi:hypothetical protein
MTGLNTTFLLYDSGNVAYTTISHLPIPPIPHRSHPQISLISHRLLSPRAGPTNGIFLFFSAYFFKTLFFYELGTCALKYFLEKYISMQMFGGSLDSLCPSVRLQESFNEFARTNVLNTQISFWKTHRTLILWKRKFPGQRNPKMAIIQAVWKDTSSID